MKKLNLLIGICISFCTFCFGNGDAVTTISRESLTEKIENEFYLNCYVTATKSKITFIFVAADHLLASDYEERRVEIINSPYMILKAALKMDGDYKEVKLLQDRDNSFIIHISREEYEKSEKVFLLTVGRREEYRKRWDKGKTYTVRVNSRDFNVEPTFFVTDQKKSPKGTGK